VIDNEGAVRDLFEDEPEPTVLIAANLKTHSIISCVESVLLLWSLVCVGDGSSCCKYQMGVELEDSQGFAVRGLHSGNNLHRDYPALSR
jgi:hypothetical protein